ncbi:MAG: hypothetical protein WCT31_01475 [Candidatus Micrarchaeia archaeon]|jgi:hypothetical protein
MNTIQSRTNYRFPNKVVPFFKGLAHGEPLVEVAREGLKRDVKPYTRAVYELRVNGKEKAVERLAERTEQEHDEMGLVARKRDDRGSDLAIVCGMLAAAGGSILTEASKFFVSLGITANLILDAILVATVTIGIVGVYVSKKAGKIQDICDGAAFARISKRYAEADRKIREAMVRLLESESRS